MGKKYWFYGLVIMLVIIMLGINIAGKGCLWQNEKEQTSGSSRVITVPYVPLGLSAVAMAVNRISLIWSVRWDNQHPLSGFKVERKSGLGGNYTQIISLGPNIFWYDDNDVLSGTTYYYRLKAYNQIGDGPYSPEASATTPSLPLPSTPPQTPTNLTAYPLSSAQINLAWQDNSNNENGFKIERGITDTAFTQIGTVSANTLSYTDSRLSPSTTYYYQIRAYNSAGESSYSNVISATTIIEQPATIVINSPNGGESWLVYSSQGISWTTTGSISSVNLEYSKDNFISSVAIAIGIANTGVYNWTIPNDPGITVKVKVSDSSNPAILDISDSDFTITPGAGSWVPITTVGAPEARSNHASVWTGDKMIIWGGSGNNGVYLNTGAIYDPLTDSWTTITTTNAPSAREPRINIWTGSEMIIWGGNNADNSARNSGAKYNLSLDKWTTITTTNAPMGRDNHTAVWTGIEVIFWAGFNNIDSPLNPYLNTGAKYYPATNTWMSITTNNTPTSRTGHTAVWTGTEMLIWGGGTGGGGYVNTGGKYNSFTDTWSLITTTNAPLPRGGHTAIWTGSEIIIWGGIGNNSTVDYLNSGAKYNPFTDTWVPMMVINTPLARYNHTAIWTGSEMIVWGGYNYYNSPSKVLNIGAKYIPVSDTWTAVTLINAPFERSNHSAIWTGTKMIIFGGYSGTPGIKLNTGTKYQP